MSRNDLPDPDDMFADTRMTFGEHIEDLRTHLIRAIYGFVVGMLIALFFAKTILGFITEPVNQEMRAFFKRTNERRAIALKEKMDNNDFARLPPMRLPVMIKRADGEKIAKPGGVLGEMTPGILRWLEEMEIDFLVEPNLLHGGNWEKVEMLLPDPLRFAEEMQKLQQIVNPPSLTTLSIQEPFVVFFKIAIMAGFVISSPIVFYQIWAFVAAGLYPSEKRLVRVYLPISLGLFAIGVIVCQFIVIPKAVAALLWFNEWLDLQPDLRLNEWLGFAIFMPVVFGFSFQTPLVMLFAYMIGVADIQTYKDKRRIAILFMAVFAAVITPSVDAFGMMFMFVPMCFLYEVGIWMCMFKKREERLDWEDDESHELIEV